MSQEKDAPNVVIQPPIALAVAVIVCLGLNYLIPCRSCRPPSRISRRV